jgi:hypothetical protein
MGSPIVSVVMSVFNGQVFLSEAIESVLSQTFRDFEFLVIDDGSTDTTAEILSTYASRDARMVFSTKKTKDGRHPLTFLRISERSRSTNLDKPILKYRIHADQVSVRNLRHQVVKNCSSTRSVFLIGSRKSHGLVSDGGRESPCLPLYVGPYETGAMNRTWDNRRHLMEMGNAAEVDVRKTVSKDPSEDFARELVTLADGVNER